MKTLLKDLWLCPFRILPFGAPGPTPHKNHGHKKGLSDRISDDYSE